MTATRLEELTERLLQLLPPGSAALQEDVKKNLRAILNSALARMELVTREEFDVQRALLARTHLRLEAIEARVAELEPERGSESRRDIPTD